MMKSNLFNILKKELREMFRDKKSLSMMLVMPIMIPLLVIGMSALFEMQMSKDVSEYNKIGFAYTLDNTEKEIAKQTKIDVTEGTEKELKEKYENGDIDLYITKEGNTYTINGENDDNTAAASNLMESYFAIYKEYLQTAYLSQNNIEASKVTNIITVKENIEEIDNYFADYITSYAFLFIIMAITISATYPATDATAGEKERGTLETLLTFPIKSKDIIVGKFLSVSLSSIITGIISLILMIVSLIVAGDMFSIYEDVNLMLSPASLIFGLITIVAYSFLISGLCIAIASKSKTFKEAQSALTPLTFVAFFPGLIAFMIGIENNTLYSLIPFLNFTLIFNDISSGTVNYLDIILMLISTVIIIVIVLFVIIKQYKSEKVLFSK